MMNPAAKGKDMKKSIMVMMCSLLFAMFVYSFAEEKNGPDPSVSAYEHANENAKFKRSRALFNNKENQEIRAQRLAEKEAKEAAEAKKKAEEAQDKGEGQVKVKF